MGDVATVAPIAVGMGAVLSFAAALLVHLSRVQGDSRQNNKSHYEVMREAEARAQRLEDRIVKLLDALEIEATQRRAAEDQAARLRLQIYELGGGRGPE